MVSTWICIRLAQPDFIPEKFGTANISQVFKGRASNQPTNYLPVSLMSVLVKVLKLP